LNFIKFTLLGMGSKPNVGLLLWLYVSLF
jgi:hypothetical protein